MAKTLAESAMSMATAFMYLFPATIEIEGGSGAT